MRIVVHESHEDVALALGTCIVEAMAVQPNLVLGLPGEIFDDPAFFLALDHLLRELGRRGLTLDRVRFFATHEYLGFGPRHPASNAYNLWHRIFSRLGIPPKNINLIDGSVADPEFECMRYETAIKTAGGIDLQLLTLGIRGEVARNEPTSSLGSRCRLKTLFPEEFTPAPARFPPAARPRFVLTMGVATLYEAKKVVFVATGFERASAVARAFDGPVSSTATASAFQKHSNCLVLLDRTAAAYSRASRS